MSEVIVSAAIKQGDFTLRLPPPSRHNDIIRELDKLGFSSEFIANSDQGFWTSEKRFVDRKEALRIAIESGELKKTPHPSGQLYSEDLW